MADKLDLTFVAEGIETSEQLALVRELGCQQGQGYYWTRPIPIGEITKLIPFRVSR